MKNASSTKQKRPDATSGRFSMAIFLVDESQRATGLASSAGAADAVDIVLIASGQIKIDDMADVGNVESARSYIGGH